MQKKHIFISHSALDNDKVDILESIMKKHKSWSSSIIIVREKTDEFILSTEKIKAGLDKCDIFIPIITNNSLTAQWLNQEIGYIFGRKPLPQIIPIATSEVREKLSGFIHKGYNIQNVFEGNAEISKENTSFELCATSLFTSLAKTYKQKRIKNSPIMDLFQGTWRMISSINGNHSNETFTIENGNQYYVNDIHLMNIEEFQINETNNRFSFIKQQINPPFRKFGAHLNIIESDKLYEGNEVNSKVNKAVSVTYKRVK